MTEITEAHDAGGRPSTDVADRPEPGPRREKGERLRLSRYHVCSEVASVDGTRLRVVMATRTGEVVQVAEELWQQLLAGVDVRTIDPTLVDLLVEIELLVDVDAEVELGVVLGRSRRAIDADEVLKVVVQPSAACQLDCVYCGQVHRGDKLCADHQHAVIERTRQRLETGSYRTLSVGWFGSEPLLALDVMRSMTPPLRELAASAGCSYDCTIVTNGLRLTPDVARELDEQHVTMAEITIDGPQRWHDRQRNYKSGRGSFAKILTNLVDVARSPHRFAISLRCNVTAESAPDIPEFIDLLAELGLQDSVNRVYFAPIHSWGNDAQELSLDRATFAAHEIGWMAQLLRLGFDVGSLPEPKPIVCMATSKSAELVDAFGEVFNCTEVSYVPTYGTPNRYALGTLDDGVEDERRQLLGNFNDRVEAGEVPCRSCRMLPVCGGSCPKAWLDGETPCPSFKWHLGTRLLLELGRHRQAVTVADRPVEVPSVAEVLARIELSGDEPEVPADVPVPPARVTPVTLRPRLAAAASTS